MIIVIRQNSHSPRHLNINTWKNSLIQSFMKVICIMFENDQIIIYII